MTSRGFKARGRGSRFIRILLPLTTRAPRKLKMIQKYGAVLAVLVLAVHVSLLVTQVQASSSSSSSSSSNTNNNSTNSSAVSTMGGSSCSTLLLTPLAVLAPLLYSWFQ